MGKHNIAQVLIFLLNLGTLLISLACPTCPYIPPDLPPKHPPYVKPPASPTKPPPVVKPPPPYVPNPPPYIPKPPPNPPPYVPNPPPYIPKPPPIVYPPIKPEPPIVPNPPPYIPKPPPIVYPPIKPEPPIVPIIKPPPIETPCPPPPPPKQKETCPIDTLKLGACVDLLGGLGHLIIGTSAKDTCCPVLEGLVDADAALCLCTTIKARLLNINIILPIALEVLVDCGKTPPAGFQCPA